MRLATTAALGAAVLVLSAAIHRVDRKPLAGKHAAALAKVLVRFEPESIDRIELVRGGSRTVLVKRSGAWFFTEPEQDRVDAVVATALLDRLNHLGIVDDLEGSGEKPELAPLGLAGDQAIRVILSGGEGEGKAIREDLVLGIAAPRTGSIYARREGGAPGTFVVDGNPRPWLESPLEAMRDRRVLGAPAGAVTQLVIRQASGEVALQRRIVPPVQDWALVAPITSWADREAMDRLLTALGSMQIEEVVSGAAPSEAIPNPLPEGAAVLQARVHEVEQPLTIFLRQVGEAADGRPLLEVRASDRPAVYRLASDFLAGLPESANALRDRRLARIPAEFLEAIKIQSRVDPLVDLRAERGGANVSWKVVLSNKLTPAKQSEVNQLVTSVNEAAIREFTSDAGDLAAHGLKTPHRRLFFELKLPGETRPDGSPGAARALTRILNLGWPDDDPQRLFANFEGEPHVYELDPTFLNAIPTHPVKWKSLNVLTFNPMHLVSITREMPEKEHLKLVYDYRQDRWEATRSGLDVTASLDIASARLLRDRLGSLTASGWYLSLGAAYEALKTPSVEFSIVTRELDRAVGEGRETTRHIRFAPTVGDLYFGQIDGSPDVFFLDRATYGDLIRGVTTARLPNP